MISRIWKGIWEDKPKCNAEMKLGIQVFRDIHCQLAKDHAGRHQANALTQWPRKPGEHRPGGPEDL
jgi:hypothetical protein